jgi:long-chain acyl-CoA synthetase
MGHPRKRVGDDVSFLGLGRSNGPALIDSASGAVLSYRELYDQAIELFAPVSESKALVFLLSRNDLTTVLTYAGAMLHGHAVALLDAQAPDGTNAELIRAYRASWVAGPIGLSDRLLACDIPVRTILAWPGGELVRTGYPPEAVHRDLALMLATSGTTGSRKFVRLSAANVEANARSILEYLSLDQDERPITSLPLHYSFGLSVLNSHLLAGAGVVLTTSSVLQPSFWDVFRAESCTSLSGVPFTFQMLERIGFRQMALPSLRMMTQAGGALDRGLTEVYSAHMASRGGRFYVMYGQTEATARIAYVPPARLSEKLGSAGIAIPGGRLMIDPDGTDTSSGWEVGEVVYEGPNVMMGYASGPKDLIDGDDLGGVLRTGDIGYLDDEGFLFLVGRSKRIAKVFGMRVNLDELEHMVRESGPAAVVGGHDAIWAFCAFGSPSEVEQLGRSVALRVRLHHSALRFRHVEAIPTTSSGKTDYAQVQRWLP